MREATRPDHRWVDASGAPMDEEDRGLVYDLQTLVDRPDEHHDLHVGRHEHHEHDRRRNGERPDRGAGRDRRPLPGRRFERTQTSSTTPESSAPTSGPASAARRRRRRACP